MTAPVDKQLEELIARTSANCGARGVSVASGIESAAKLQVLWTNYLMSTQLTGVADGLLQGAMSAIREGAACIALGLVRPALNSLRLQIDLSFGWIYFKDHPVEWGLVQKT